MRLQDALGRAGGRGWEKKKIQAALFLLLSTAEVHQHNIGLIIYCTEKKMEYIPAKVFMFYSVCPHVSFVLI